MADSCLVITGRELFPTKEECFEVSIQKGELAYSHPQVTMVKPLCQIIPEGEKT
tara:strand:+ start:205 stop:366 length:162 start_codon:yes stop_codon:yes gene_type:complete